jgi:hypothetical protein
MGRISRKAFATAAGLVVATTRSTSFTVSIQRRRLPPTSAAFTEAWPRRYVRSSSAMGRTSAAR